MNEEPLHRRGDAVWGARRSSCGCRSRHARCTLNFLHPPAPCTLHPAPCTLHPEPLYRELRLITCVCVHSGPTREALRLIACVRPIEAHGLCEADDLCASRAVQSRFLTCVSTSVQLRLMTCVRPQRSNTRRTRPSCAAPPPTSLR